MNSEVIKQKTEILNALKQRLQMREIQYAKLGLSADPAIPIEIEDIKNRISDVQSEIQALQASAQSLTNGLDNPWHTNYDAIDVDYDQHGSNSLDFEKTNNPDIFQTDFLRIMKINGYNIIGDKIPGVGQWIEPLIYRTHKSRTGVHIFSFVEIDKLEMPIIEQICDLFASYNDIIVKNIDRLGVLKVFKFLSATDIVSNRGLISTLCLVSFNKPQRGLIQMLKSKNIREEIDSFYINTSYWLFDIDRDFIHKSWEPGFGFDWGFQRERERLIEETLRYVFSGLE